MPKIIGIAGRARSGKDTVANMILSMRGGYSYSFADPLRAMLRAINIDMDDQFWKDNKEVSIPALGKSPREMLQTLGTDWGRRLVNEDIWIIMAMERLMNRGPGMVIADVRFDNEAQWVRSQGGMVLHLSNPNVPAVAAHVSENGVTYQLGDSEITNDGSLEDLLVKVKELLSGVNQT